MTILYVVLLSSSLVVSVILEDFSDLFFRINPFQINVDTASSPNECSWSSLAIWEIFICCVSKETLCHSGLPLCGYTSDRLSVYLSMCQFVRHTELNSVYLFANGLSHNKSLTAGVSVYVLGFSSSPEAEAAKSFLGLVGGWDRLVERCGEVNPFWISCHHHEILMARQQCDLLPPVRPNPRSNVIH